MISGRTQSIISRFPEFYYISDNPDSSFFQLLEVFGTILEQAEKDLMRVLRSHFYGTAENIDSQEFAGKYKGDLDRIFALYLEPLGIASQLVQVNLTLEAEEFKQLDELIEMLLEAEKEQQHNQPITAYLWGKLSLETQKLLQNYGVENVRFQETLGYPPADVQEMLKSGEKKQALLQLPLSPEIKSQLATGQEIEEKQLEEELTAAWVLKLKTRKDSLTQYLRSGFSAQTQQLLKRYDGRGPVPLEIKRAIASHLNQNILPNSLFAHQVLRHNSELSAQLTCLQELVVPSEPKKIGKFLLPRLSPGLQIALRDSETLTQLNSLYLRITSELRPQLQSPRFATQIHQQLKQLETPDQNLHNDLDFILWQALRTALTEILEGLVARNQWVIWADLLRRYELAAQQLQIGEIPDLENLSAPFLPLLQPLLQSPALCRSLDNLAQEIEFITVSSPDFSLPEETFRRLWLIVRQALHQEILTTAFSESTQQELLTRFREDHPAENRPIVENIQVMLAQFLVGGIPTTTSPVSPLPELGRSLPIKLNELFADATVCQQLLTLFQEVEKQAVPPLQQPISHLLGALIAASQTLLREQFKATLQQTLNQLQLSPDLQTFINQKPSGEHLERLNRQLLEAVFPLEIPPSRICSRTQIAKELAKELNREVLNDRELYPKFQQFFSDLSLPLTAQYFIQDYQQNPDKFPSEKLIFLNRLLLESAYPRQIERSDTPYRERLRRLIGVLKKGASPTDGIIEIVAANLGMNTDLTQEIKPWEEYLFDLPNPIEITHLDSLTASEPLRQAFNQHNYPLSAETNVVMEKWMQVWIISDRLQGQVYRLRRHSNGFSVHRQLIRVIEYQAEGQKQQITVRPHSPFTLNNSSASTEAPILELTLKDSRLGAKERNLPPFKVLRIRNETTQKYVEYQGEFNIDRVLRFSPDGSVLNGGIPVPRSTIQGRLPTLPIGNSIWCIEAEIEQEKASFDEINLDFARFDLETKETSLQTFQMDCYDIAINVMPQDLAYGRFTVKIPWDIPNYTEQFNETEDHPRYQIYGLIEKVRAAGVSFSISYEKFIPPEFHEIEDKLDSQIVPLEVKQKTFYENDEPGNFMEHDMSDRLILAQIFDCTYFDSLNPFA